MERLDALFVRLKERFGDYVAGSIVTFVAGILFMALVELLIVLFPAG